MSTRHKGIKVPAASKINTEVKVSLDGKEVNKRYPVFSFRYFCGRCLRVDKEVNNFYHKDEDAAADVGRFYDIVKEISGHTLAELRRGKVFRFHPISEQKNIDNIEKFLSAHGFTDEQLRDFRASYMQFGLNDGGRAICRQINQVIYVLFIDANHFIYDSASKNRKQKQYHCVPGYFTKEDACCDYRSFIKAEMIDDLLNDFDSYKTKEDLRAHLKFISNPDKNRL